MQIFKEDPDIIGICQPCPGGSILADAPEKLLAERWECHKNIPHFLYISNILLVMIIIVVFGIHYNSHPSSLPF